MKNVVVTGASRGIGRAIALELGKRGYRVLVNYNESREKAEEIGKIIGEAVPMKADVSKYDEVEKMIEVFCERYGKIYALILNAGIYIRKNVWEMSLEDWKKQ